MIVTRGLVVSYRGGFRRPPVKALAGIDLTIDAGDCFGLLGHNGAGKSTALGCLLGLIRPTAGEVTVLGERPRAGSETYRHLGYLPEEPIYHGHLTVAEALTYYARLQGIRDVGARMTTLLERLDLAQWRDQRIDRCSKGMKQKVGIIQALLHEPRLLLLDEPMRGLDPLAVMAFRDLLLEANANGTTILLSSHLLARSSNRPARSPSSIARVVAHDIRRQPDRQRRTALRRGRGRDRHDARACPGSTSRRASTASCAARRTGGPPDFFDGVRAGQLTLVSCALERATLEEAY